MVDIQGNLESIGNKRVPVFLRVRRRKVYSHTILRFLHRGVENKGVGSANYREILWSLIAGKAAFDMDRILLQFVEDQRGVTGDFLTETKALV